MTRALLAGFRALLSAMPAAADHCPPGQFYRVRLNQCVGLNTRLASAYVHASASHIRVDRANCTHHCSARSTQTPHGGGEARDPLACFKSPVDERCGEGAVQSDPEHDRETPNWLSKVTRWPTNFLRAMINERSA